MINARKDPNSIEDFVLDWSQRIGSDTISSATWSVSGVTAASNSNTTTTATVRLSGGSVDADATATCRVTLASGQVMDATIYLTLREE